MTQPIEIRIKRGTAAYLAELNPVLAPGEPCIETDTNKIKYGDGTTPWTLLEYSNGADIPSFGTDNVASGVNAFVGGGASNTASAENAGILGGTGNVAAGVNSVAFGADAKTTKRAQLALSGGKFNETGDAQTSTYVLRVQTLDDTPALLSLNGVANSGQYLQMLPGTVWMFNICAAAYNVTDSTAGTWNIYGGIKRDLAGNFDFLGMPGNASWVDASWDSGAGVVATAQGETDPQPFGLGLLATGSAGKNIYWTATVTTTELKPKPPLTSDMFVEVPASAAVTTLAVEIDGGGTLQPAFDPAIQDYCIHANNGPGGTSTYSVTINNGSAVTGNVDVNQALHITYGAQEYFIRVLPVNFPVPTVTAKNPGYHPGYYLMSLYNMLGWNYTVVYNENMVPVWYAENPPGAPGVNSLHCTVENRLAICSGAATTRYVVNLGLNQQTVSAYTMKNDSTNSNPFWECHEAHVIAGPPERRNNFISMTYAYGCSGAMMPGNGLYIQELSADGQTIVWDWHSNDYFDISPYGDYFHANSVDVNPVTGHVLVSCRHVGGGMCIDYNTKEVLWLLQGTPSPDLGGGTFAAVQRPGMFPNTHILTITGDPNPPPKANHDARWHSNIAPLTPGNQIVSFYDNHTWGAGGVARGVVYEIDLNTNQAIFRGHAYREDGYQSNCCGSFTLVKELDGSYTYLPWYWGASDAFKEYNNGTNIDPDQNIVFTVNMFNSGDAYRVIKVRPDFLNIDYMRTTAGRTLPPAT